MAYSEQEAANPYTKAPFVFPNLEVQVSASYPTINVHDDFSFSKKRPAEASLSSCVGGGNLTS